MIRGLKASVQPLLRGLGLSATFGLLACTQLSPAAPQATPRVPTDNPRLLAVLTPAPRVAGDPNAGRQLFAANGCAACHTLRGVPQANGIAGPNLSNITLRPTLAAGAVPNTPENLANWIKNAPSMKPGTAMPPFESLTDPQTRDLAAFLYSGPYNAP